MDDIVDNILLGLIVRWLASGGWFNGDMILDDDIGGIPTFWVSLPGPPAT